MMTEFLVHAYLYLDMLIKLLFVVVLILWIVTPIYALKVDKSKKKELERLKDLNNGIELLMGIPIKQAREFIKGNKNH